MKRVSKALSALICASLLTAGLTGCGGEKSADTIKIGANLELTGNSASYGTSVKNGIEMAVKEINDAGGLLGQVTTGVVCQLRNTDNYADVYPAANSKATVGGLVGRADLGQLHTSTNHATLTTGSGTRGSLIGQTNGSLTVNDCCTDQGNTGLPLCAEQASTQPCNEKHRKGL